VFDIALDALQLARRAGFRVATNTTLYAGADPEQVRRFFDRMMDLGVEGMMISPGYSYAKAPDQEHFLSREAIGELFRRVFSPPKRRWRFNQTPLFLEFLQGNIDLDCLPWGNPTYNVLGWQRPCYLLDEGYCATFRELVETTDWSRYGHRSGNEKCRDCMVHCGYEPSAVLATLGSWKGIWRTLQIMLHRKRPTSAPPPSRSEKPAPFAPNFSRAGQNSKSAGELPS
jgi:hopanoid biosynthesis associated radical SAM protein HpnH